MYNCNKILIQHAPSTTTTSIHQSIIQYFVVVFFVHIFVHFFLYNWKNTFNLLFLIVVDVLDLLHRKETWNKTIRLNYICNKNHTLLRHTKKKQKSRKNGLCQVNKCHRKITSSNIEKKNGTCKVGSGHTKAMFCFHCSR